MTVRNRSIRRAFLVSASFPAAAVLGLVPAAAQTVTVSDATTAAAVNTKIATAIAAPSRDLKVDVTTAGTITIPTQTILLLPSAGQGDGTIVFNNAGKIGSLDTPPEAVRVTLRGSPSKADNTIAVTNSGLITRGVDVGTFDAAVGGDATFSNLAGGQIFGGVSTFANGNIKADVATGSTISSGGLSATNSTIFKSTKSDDGVITTESQTSGTNTISVAGDLVSVDGKTRGNVSGSSLAGSTINVAGTVGTITATGSGSQTSTFLTAPGNAVADKTVTTANESTTFGDGKVSVSLSGKASGISAFARTAVAVSVDGANTGGVDAIILSANNSNRVATETQDKTGFTTETTEVFTSKAVGGTATLSIAATGSVDGAVNVSGDAGAVFVNAGTVGKATAPIFINVQSTRTIANALFQNKSTFAVADLSDSTIVSTKQVTQTVGGPIAFTNEQGGLISGNAALNGLGDVSVTNAGTMRGALLAMSAGFTTTNAKDQATTNVTVPGVAPALTVSTTTTKSVSSSVTASTGGSVSGTYSGTNGSLNFTPVINGSVAQNAARDSSATVSGTIFGSLTSNAGQGTNSSSLTTEESTNSFDTAATGTVTFSNVQQNTKDGVAGVSTVSVTGVIGDNDIASAALKSAGSSKATLALTGKVEGGATVSALGVSANKTNSSLVYSQTFTTGVGRTDKLSEANTTVNETFSAGSALADLTGKASILGTLAVNGNTDAAATVANTATIGTKAAPASLFVNAGVSDNQVNSTNNVYSFDAKTKLGSSVATATSSEAPSIEAATASATIAGSVFGSTFVNAPGTATVVLTGVSSNGVFVDAGESRTETKFVTNKSGTPTTPDATSFFGATLGLSTTSTVQTNAGTNVAGSAIVTINTAADLQAGGKAAIDNGGITVEATQDATVTIGQGSIVRGGAFIDSAEGGSFSFTEARTFVPNAILPIKLETSLIEADTGGAAILTNAGTLEGTEISVHGFTSSTVTNSGKLGGGASGNTALEVTAGGEIFTETLLSTNRLNPALRRDVTTTTTSAMGGDAKFTNNAGAILFGNATIAGKTGSVVNNGVITGLVTLGAEDDDNQGIPDFTTIETRTASSTLLEVTQPTTRFTQTYTVNQNGVSGGFGVVGATVVDPTDPNKTLRTSDITATINLNKGSATLDDIFAQQDAKTGERLTNTTVNLNDSGFLGADYIVTGTVPPAQLNGLPTPLLMLPAKVGGMFFPGLPDGFADEFDVPVTVRGVANLNKTGAGTFVIVGTPFAPSTGPGDKADWTLEVGAFNNKAGEVQLALPAFSDSKAEFGILGNVSNDATLVLGRRVPTAITAIGNSLVNTGPETIDGIIVRQQGNFVQSGTGALVVGITPSLVRGQVGIDNDGGASELLGPVTAGVNIPFFTTAERAGVVAGNSALNITGDLNLGGTVRLDVTRDSLFTAGDGYTLITYTGVGTVPTTTTVTPSLTSRFVNFTLNHNTTAKTVSIAAARTSYGTGATDPNAASAAVGLDSTLPVIVSSIRTDANGGSGFQTVSQIGFAQDVANIATALDYRLSAEQAAQVFRELSSAEIYGSLSSLNQNVVFGDTVNMLTLRRDQGGQVGTSLWANPVGNFGRYGGTSSGASRIKATTYGVAFGLDIAYSEDGVFGIGGAYAEHDVNARQTPEQADARTWTIGAYANHRFNERLYANALFAYGFTRFNVDRDLTLLARSISSSFRGTQVDASLEVGYEFGTESLHVTPFGKVTMRRLSMNGFTETGGGGIGLVVAERSKSIFSPVFGARLGGEFEATDSVTLRPFIRGSFTFQGDIGADRSVSYLVGGNAFTLVGVRPSDYGTIDLGFDSDVGERLNLFLTGGQSFGGSNKVSTVRAGVNVRF